MIRILHGDCRDLLKTLPDESVHCVVCSPPYFGLRDYGTGQWTGGDSDCDHLAPIGGGFLAAGLGDRPEIAADKVLRRRQQYRDECGHCGARRTDSQIGLEATPDAYVAEMVAVFREVRRVMRHDATAWINLGDSHSNKQLLGIPWRVAFALQNDGWILRQDVIWSKPNPMPESVRDRCTKAHEYLFLLSKSPRYFYDAEAIAEPVSETNGAQAWRRIFDPSKQNKEATLKAQGIKGGNDGSRDPTATARNKRSVWEVATAPFSEAHFATFPPALIEPCILAGCPAKACATCGKPWVREVEREGSSYAARKAAGVGGPYNMKPQEYQTCGTSTVKTLGFSPSCSCNAATVPGTCLDPFAGAGTTGLVADRLGRNAVLIELNAGYMRLATERIVADAPLFADIVNA